MPVMILEQDPFVEILSELSDNPLSENSNVRRPLYGIRTKENRWAFLSVYRASSLAIGGLASVSLIDSSAPDGHSLSNHNFILQSVQVSRQEKAQIVETFGDHFVFFFGERPVVYQCSGMLLNTRDFNWKNEWLANYQQHLRGTKCVENKTRVYMGFDDMLVEGYVLSTSVSYNKDLPYMCPFNFTMLVTKETDLSDYNEPVRQLEHARTTVGDATDYVEYLTETEGFAEWKIDPITGELVVTGQDGIRRIEAPEFDALQQIEAELIAQQLEIDADTARRQAEARARALAAEEARRAAEAARQLNEALELSRNQAVIVTQFAGQINTAPTF